MAIIKLSITETLKYQRQMTIDVPENMSEQTLNSILTEAERYTFSAGEFADKLDDCNGITVIERPDEDMSSPYDAEVESDYLD
jgi:hypothetical protein